MTDPLIRYRGELLHDGKPYFLAYCVLALEPILLVPLLLSYLSSEQLGLLGAVEALNVVLCGVSQLGVKFAYLQFVADRTQPDRGNGFWTATSLTTLAGLASGMLAAAFLDSFWLVPQFGKSAQIDIAGLGVLLFATNLQMMLVTDLRAKRKPMPLVFASLLRVAVCYCLLVWQLPSSPAPINDVFWAQGFGLCASIVLLWRTADLPPPSRIEARLARDFMRYGWPIATGGLIKYGTDALLPWFCLMLVSPAAAGAMALAMKTSAVFDTCFGLPFLMAWGGRVYEWLKDQASAALVFPRLFSQTVAAGAVAAIFAWAIGELMLHFSSAEAGIAIQTMWLLPFALLGKLLFVLRSPATAGFLLTRDMRWNIRYTVVQLLLFAILGPLSFKALGIAGGWVAFLSVEAIILAWMFRRSNTLLRSTAFDRDRICLE